ncbi:GPH family glycoside/pentoside/hexuronide:cation symporter [Kushneria sinocarnis]|uniref:GPH family glycoside/pentoside/hexuronide:cation symporter n=1 Tax=Kushneria sinocarnis TaxID=595502 RepID=A0A420WWM7_9GAMM|nr:MFS transporter [Kushneria sinocarnis]RKR03511.1 GPH family glycoside/pentoside/hexuronide:cation symporter [Kushneria sinocarnis]
MQGTRLGIIEKIGFGMGDAGNNMTFAAVVMYLSYFYTDVYGISPAVVGTIFLSMRFVDAVTDPLMGAIADRTHSRWGRFRPWLLFIPVPLAAACVLMFTTPDFSQGGKILYAFVTYAVMSLLYTAVNIPYCALGGVITSDHRERVSCQSWRFVLVGVAYLILNSGLLPLVEWFGGGDEAFGFQITMGLMCVIALGMYAFCFATVRERITPPVQSSRNPWRDLRTLAANPKWCIILSITFLQALQFFLRQGAAVYYANWVLGLGATGISLFVTLGVVGKMIGTAVSPLMTGRISKRSVFLGSTLLLILASALLFVIPGSTLIVATLVFILINFFHGIGTPVSWALMADAEDYGEWRNGHRLTGVSFAGNLFFLKLGLALGGGLIGFLLSWGGYDAGLEQQGSDALLAITLMLTLIPAAICVLMWGAIWLFGLDDRTMDRIHRDFEARSDARHAAEDDRASFEDDDMRPASTHPG